MVSPRHPHGIFVELPWHCPWQSPNLPWPFIAAVAFLHMLQVCHPKAKACSQFTLQLTFLIKLKPRSELFSGYGSISTKWQQSQRMPTMIQVNSRWICQGRMLSICLIADLGCLSPHLSVTCAAHLQICSTGQQKSASAVGKIFLMVAHPPLPRLPLQRSRKEDSAPGLGEALMDSCQEGVLCLNRDAHEEEEA